MHRLLDRRRKLAQEFHLPEGVLRGSVYVRTLRCGKAGCHCASDGGHRAAYLSVTHPGGRTEQISLPVSLLPVAQQWVANYVKLWRLLEKVSSIDRQILRYRRDAERGRRRNLSAKRKGSGRR
jgi:hypothetical protein